MAYSNQLKILIGLLYLTLQSKAAERCHYYYTIQPGPPRESCNFEKTTEIYFELQCQVSSNRSHYGIEWHYSSSQPQLSNVLSAANSIDNLNLAEIKTESDMQSMIVISSLSFRYYGEDGYIWCSVNDSQTTARNPSSVLHISPCSANNQQCVQDNIHLYRMYSVNTARCADQEASVDVIQALNCSLNPKVNSEHVATTAAMVPRDVGMTVPKTTGPRDVEMTVPKTTGQNRTTTVKTTAASHTYIITGASLGGVIVVLFCVIVLYIVCAVRTRLKHHTREHRATNELTPFDDIRMNLSTKTIETCKMDDPIRVSELLCDSNICYEERPHFPFTKSIDNIYEYMR